ncbi:Uncharacterized conserved protein YegP, UPF0339 family [Robiginitalea myxolifaciens]|uniref:Uncharacterized conserved protein YegP, UPF0339 family n=1 Tax=Robiginitalea myxolifaciens TaxID=400055 RepID=A0A1I6G402_9FLAO|nr:YegP family protein [Robiginitalea myxolifaciens]SFR36861.1 Uncharacterized conserved protein YegP, UPF0339 family [Robiginitalea myxolifaciens]
MSNSITGYYTLFTGKDGNYYFNLKAGNNKIILRGTERYRSKSDCLTGIRSVQQHGPNRANYVVKTAVNGQPYFVLKARNNEVIGFGETYTSQAALNNGIRSVMENSQSRVIKGTDESYYEINVGGKEFDVKEGSYTREQILELAGLRGRWCLFLLNRFGGRTEITAGQSIEIRSCLRFAVVRLD